MRKISVRHLFSFLTAHLIMTTKENTVTVATFFIGGAADKNRFFLAISPTHLLRNALVTRYFQAITTLPLGQAEVNQSFADAYFGYDEMDQLFARIQELRKRMPTVKIRLLGHSLGGWQAAKMSTRLAGQGIMPSLLVTLDPVGIAYFMNFPGRETSLPRPEAALWLNVCANATNDYSTDDAIADAGVRWRPYRDTALKRKPNFDIGTPYSHADVWRMMTFPGANGKSAWQLLTAMPQ